MDVETEVTRRSVAGKARAAVILGNDALVAARPCTPHQLASACKAAGFDVVVPPTWGDELVAATYLEQLARCADRATVACACPRVRSLLGQLPPDRAPTCVAIASPPMAAARYVRGVYGADVLITYVGDCPSATDPAIDSRISPSGFLASLQRQGISLSAQSTGETSPNGSDWRRYLSTPGGLPARRFLARAPVDRVVREVELSTIGHGSPASRSNMVLDLTAAAGCSCAGHADEIADREPARAVSPVLVSPAGLDLTAHPSPRRVRPTVRASRSMAAELPVSRAPSASVPGPAAPEPDANATVPEPKPVVLSRDGSAPVDTPRVLPMDAAPHASEVMRTPLAASSETPVSSPTPDAVPAAQQRGPRSMFLLILPVAILGGVAALGIAAYATGASERGARAAVVPAEPPRSGDSASASTAALGERSAPALADSDSTRSDTMGARTPAAPIDTASAASTRVSPESTTVVADSTPNRPTPKPRRPRPQVIPGWMPQGDRAWTPETTGGRKPDSTPAPKPRPDRVPPA